jgi:hypothetical protein
MSCGMFSWNHSRVLIMRDAVNLDYLRELERRLRSNSHNYEERELFLVTSLEKVDGWALPVDGEVTADSLKRPPSGS